MSDFRTDLGGAGPRIGDDARTDQTRTQTGSLNGRSAQVVDQSSLLADAAEELTSQLSEKTEKDLAKRDVEAGSKSDSLERVLRVQEIQDMLDALGDLSKEDLFRSLKRLLQRQDGQRGYREQAEQDFEEPSHQYTALSALVETLKARGAPATQIAEAQAACDELVAEHGAAIRGALNIGHVAGDPDSADLGSRSDLRATYRESTADYRNMGSAMKALTDKFGLEKLPQAIAFMTKALGADIAAAGSSVDKAKLKVILSDLKRVQVLTTILGNADVVADRARARGAGSGVTGALILSEMVPMLDQSTTRAGFVFGIVDAMGLDDTATRINALTDIKHLADAVPVTAFVSADGRRNALDAIQDALDDAIQDEEEQEDD